MIAKMPESSIPDACDQPGFGTFHFIPAFVKLKEDFLNNVLRHSATPHQRKRIVKQRRLFGLEHRLKRDFTHARSNMTVDSGSRFQECSRSSRLAGLSHSRLSSQRRGPGRAFFLRQFFRILPNATRTAQDSRTRLASAGLLWNVVDFARHFPQGASSSLL